VYRFIWKRIVGVAGYVGEVLVRVYIAVGDQDKFKGVTPRVALIVLFLHQKAVSNVNICGRCRDVTYRLHVLVD